MQFLPATWKTYGDGGNIMNPAAARLLAANGAPGHLSQAIFVAVGDRVNLLTGMPAHPEPQPPAGPGSPQRLVSQSAVPRTAASSPSKSSPHGPQARR